MLSIGLMTGTSMDGIDAALLETDGEAVIVPRGHCAIDYDPAFKILLKSVEYAIWRFAGDVTQARLNYTALLQTYLTDVLKNVATDLTPQLANYLTGDPHQPVSFDQVIAHSTFLHVTAVNRLLEKTKQKVSDIDVIGYHGQAFFHRPSQGISIVLGDGQSLADQLGITVVNNFRQRDVMLGGQGAPFAPLYHQALAVRDNKIPLAVVNCGGIANITFITGASLNDVCGFDTGPGNVLIDRYVQRRTLGKEFMDIDGKYGRCGKVDVGIMDLLHEQAVIIQGSNFLNKKPPKALDSNDLQLTIELMTRLDQLSLADACATLEAFTAQTIVSSLKQVDVKPNYWVLAGGGWNNPVILQALQQQLCHQLGPAVQVKTADEFGWNSQAMEAQIFAYFAVRSLKNLPLSTPNTTGISQAVSGGHAYLSKTSKPTSVVMQLLQANPAVLTGYIPITPQDALSP
ncbi:MAG: anhydro-N-acetylmuramic acid kinase [Coxiellaceae bacterium]|nr:MAG: anhydro-N-acetylmuramic acid kinase [Coxiellaceae bacterium]